MKSLFQIKSKFQPTGDQPTAIEGIVSGIQSSVREQVLLGVTGSGKTFTMANVIAQVQKPTLVMAPNKTLAAQLFMELREFFPNNAVHYFISFYDYYQPEAYVPSTDTFIEKDSSINDDIDKMRHAATMALFERKDVIIVASVSCIYGLGSPDAYGNLVLEIAQGQEISRNDFLKQLIEIQYTRSDAVIDRGTFRVRGDTVDLLPSYEKEIAIRVEFYGDEIENIRFIDVINGKTLQTVQHINIYPNSHYVTDKRNTKDVIKEIFVELGKRLRALQAQNKSFEAKRLEERTLRDIELIEQLGFCPGIENYSRFLNGLKEGEAPPTLLQYFPKDYLTIIDESHITLPQIRGMFRGDRARKQVLVDFGFRLPAALDNRPLNFEEFQKSSHQLVYVSATPGPYELEHASDSIFEQIIRPTGLIDPPIEIRPSKGQIDDLYSELDTTIANQGRVLITTLTKKMSEDIATYLTELGFKVRYLHSDIDSIERVEILRDLRKGECDILVGINLLREGIDLPEVQLVAVMDADKEGFLRSKTSLIQIVGRAARNSEGRVIFYADKVTDSMRHCIDETSRRRKIQIQHNKDHGIVPTTIKRQLQKSLRDIYGLTKGQSEYSENVQAKLLKKYKIKKPEQLDKLIRKLNRDMKKAAGKLQFEEAAQLRDELKKLKEILLETA